MEKSPKAQGGCVQILLPSPTSHSSTTTSSSGNSDLNGTLRQRPPPTPPKQQQQNHPQQPITRCETNPYPTTFVQADTTSFKQVVQMLTGSSETAKQASQSRPTTNLDQPLPVSKSPIPPIKTYSKAKPSRLYERRSHLKNLRLSPLLPGFSSGSGFSPRNAEILSPSLLDFPALVLSPVTPLIPDPFNRSPMSNWAPNIIVDKAAEEKAIADKGFYLHPSPLSTPRESEPHLLPLFPVISPRVSGSDSGP
ncbi:hypothetical protein Nepgr_028785 [Nepenthes gracilis]|uniref:VQ domain-containing protein n=1 Tax=Nepenthes gracilis TaxID=150966 RepID=A0AAD3TEB1_NEPGR|nr:hypothetical protein Nepgr_028785 [Nepenthes gracilis]